MVINQMIINQMVNGAHVHFCSPIVAYYHSNRMTAIAALIIFNYEDDYAYDDCLLVLPNDPVIHF